MCVRVCECVCPCLCVSCESVYLAAVRIIHFHMSFKSTLGTEEAKIIENALKDFQYYTCVRFLERKGERDYIRFISDKG